MSKPGSLQGELDDQTQWTLFPPTQPQALFTWSPCFASHMEDQGSKSESPKKLKVATASIVKPGPGNKHCFPSTVSYQSKYKVHPNSREGKINLISLWEDCQMQASLICYANTGKHQLSLNSFSTGLSPHSSIFVSTTCTVSSKLLILCKIYNKERKHGEKLFSTGPS